MDPRTIKILCVECDTTSPIKLFLQKNSPLLLHSSEGHHFQNYQQILTRVQGQWSVPIKGVKRDTKKEGKFYCNIINILTGIDACI